jgi:lysophospholipase L1-like esterase
VSKRPRPIRYGYAGAALLVVLVAYCLWQYRHDWMFRNAAALQFHEFFASSRARQLLLIGDSNISGLSCVNRFAGWDILNLGVPGLRAETLRGYVESHASRWPRFDAAILWIGINDLRTAAGAAPAAAEDTVAILAVLKSVSARLAMVQQPLLPASQGDPGRTLVNRAVTTMNSLIVQRLSTNLAAIIAPFADQKESGSTAFFIDDLHLNAQGYRRVCDEAGRWLAANG